MCRARSDQAQAEFTHVDAVLAAFCIFPKIMVVGLRVPAGGTPNAQLATCRASSVSRGVR